jgi:hypothetical protein
VVICPACRHVNAEDATVCVQCGGTLEPGFATRAAIRRTESERPPLEIQPPEPPSKWRPYVVVGVLVAVVFGGAVVYLLRPDLCGGTNFTSPNFGYCLRVPDGWEAGPARFGADVTLDQFAPPTESATVVVEAVDLETDDTLQDWSQYVRQKDESSGLAPGGISETRLGGVGAHQWDIEVTSADGRSFRMREVVAVRDGFGWRIALNDEAGDFDSSSDALQDMIESWQFR